MLNQVLIICFKCAHGFYDHINTGQHNCSRSFSFIGNLLAPGGRANLAQPLSKDCHNLTTPHHCSKLFISDAQEKEIQKESREWRAAMLVAFHKCQQYMDRNPFNCYVQVW